ncbi:MAG TPA: SUMF1/EgtB/PvdO family nonheme iron enzyme, partial [Arthrobacter sp.]|nr:SUMF1/EgtB/PvdO family nonheme iron enzyme [Arthrobacter sp.]
VWEWCADVYDEGFFRTLERDALNPICNRTSGPRVLRGGSYQSFAPMGRCAFRSSANPDDRRSDIGFRVAYKI